MTKAEKIIEHFGLQPKQLRYFPRKGWYVCHSHRTWHARTGSTYYFIGKSFYEIQCSPNWALKRLLYVGLLGGQIQGDSLGLGGQIQGDSLGRGSGIW